MSAGEDKDRDPELERLLPWLANETLSGPERERLEAYLARSPHARDELAFLRALRTSVKAAETGPTPGEMNLKRIERLIRDERRQSRRSLGWWRPVAIAAGVLLAVETGLLVGVWREPSPMMPAGVEAENDVLLQATFAPEATEREIRAVLEAAGATIADGPGALGVYRLRLPDVKPEDEDAIQRALAALRSRGDVVSSIDVER